MEGSGRHLPRPAQRRQFGRSPSAGQQRLRSGQPEAASFVQAPRPGIIGPDLQAEPRAARDRGGAPPVVAVLGARVAVALFLCALPERKPYTPAPGSLLLDGIQDPGNLGAILRTADALDIPVALLEGCADPYSHKVVRASMGAVLRTQPVLTTWEEAKTVSAQANIPIAVTALSHRAKDLRQAPLSRMTVVIGSEGQGVRQEILDSADAELVIPMNPHCESLNAAIASAIVMWQMKQ